MLGTIIFQAIISLIIIFTMHYLYIFFKNNLTTPKIKDLVNKPNEEYRKIYNTIKENMETVKNNEEKEKMKQELKDYMKSLSSKTNNKTKLKEGNDNEGDDDNEKTSDFVALDSYNNGSDMYSTF